ncbi:MAG: response regulator transcription factor [Chloroflexi bacterium]|nr:response regulator transcription factor [Chloroflexota bacterium]MDA1240775.1 response regulator transcription factor [Chloroflexota bacterium]
MPRVQSASTGVERRTLTALVIDGNVQQREALRTAFIAEGYHVHAVGDGDTGLILAREVDPDVVVLDMDIPHLSGSELTRQIRLGSSVPILVVSGRRGEHDRIHALDLGADDVLVRPFSIGELMARTRAVLRRFAHEQVELMHAGAVLQFGDCELDLARHQLRRAGVNTPLRPQERLLLEFMVRRPGQTFTRGQLLDLVWEAGSNVSIRTVDVHVRWLREKIEAEPSSPRHLLTVRRAGYRFEIEPGSDEH